MSEVEQAPRPRKQHELKCWPQFFQATREGTKRFELRRNDRDFRVGDELLLKEWDPKAEYGSPADNTEPVGYTGREIKVRVDWIMDTDTIRSLTVPPELRDCALPGIGFVIMSVSLVH